MSNKLRIGVCLLDEPQSGTGAGHFAIEGRQGRITNLSDLRSSAEILWLTNLDYETYRRHKHFKLPNVKNDQVLRSRLENIQKELGIHDLYKPEAAQVLAKIAQSTFDYTALMTGKPITELDNPQRLDWILKPRVLPTARQPVASDAASISVAMDAHMFNYAVYPTRGDYVKRFYTVPRTSMARALFSLPYPSLWKAWQQVKFDRPIVLDPDKLPAELQGKAAFVKVEMENLNPDRAAWGPFTKRREQGGSIIPRNWVALPEALSYARDATVEIREAYITDLEELKLPCPLPPPADDGMISAQIYAESYIYAIGGKTGTDQARRPKATGHCALAAYMWAYERVYMAKLAKLFQAKGMGQITTVGSLQLQVQVLPSMVDLADTLALQLCLEAPMADYQKSGLSVPEYVPYEHGPRNDRAKYPHQDFSVSDWIFNPKALVHLTPFSFLKVGGSLNDLLIVDSNSADPARQAQSLAITKAALERMSHKMLGVNWSRSK